MYTTAMSSRLQKDEIARRLRLAVVHSGESQRAIAERAGIKEQVLTNMLTGRRPGKKQLPLIASALEVPLDWLLSGEGAPKWATASEAFLSGAEENRDMTAVSGDPELFDMAKAANDAALFSVNYESFLAKEKIELNAEELLVIYEAVQAFQRTLGKSVLDAETRVIADGIQKKIHPVVDFFEGINVRTERLLKTIGKIVERIKKGEGGPPRAQDR